jgi:hypothetical protein
MIRAPPLLIRTFKEVTNQRRDLVGRLIEREMPCFQKVNFRLPLRLLDSNSER